MSDIVQRDKCTFMGVEFITKLTAARAAVNSLKNSSDNYKQAHAIRLDMDLEAIRDIIRVSLMDDTMSSDDVQDEYDNLLDTFLEECLDYLEEGDLTNEFE